MVAVVVGAAVIGGERDRHGGEGPPTPLPWAEAAAANVAAQAAATWSGGMTVARGWALDRSSAPTLHAVLGAEAHCSQRAAGAWHGANGGMAAIARGSLTAGEGVVAGEVAAAAASTMLLALFLPRTSVAEAD